MSRNIVESRYLRRLSAFVYTNTIMKAPHVALQLVTCLVLLTGCVKMESSSPEGPRTPELEAGWVTNCVGPAFAQFGGSGPGPDRPVFRVGAQLVFAVPKSYQPNAARIDHELGECRKISDLPSSDYLAFGFAGSWSAGHKREVVPPTPDHLQPDRVAVMITRSFPSALSAEEQRELERIVERERLRDLQGDAREIAGLTCVVPKIPYYPWFFCSGPRSADSKPVKLRFMQKSAQFVLILADYDSSRYGGVHVFLKALTSDISHWRSIDDGMWRLLSDWNVLPAAESQAGPRS